MGTTQLSLAPKDSAASPPESDECDVYLWIFDNRKPLPTVEALTRLSRLRLERLLTSSMESQFCSLSVCSFSQLREPGPYPALAIRVRSRHRLIEGGG